MDLLATELQEIDVARKPVPVPVSGELDHPFEREDTSPAKLEQCFLGRKLQHSRLGNGELPRCRDCPLRSRPPFSHGVEELGNSLRHITRRTEVERLAIQLRSPPEEL